MPKLVKGTDLTLGFYDLTTSFGDYSHQGNLILWLKMLPAAPAQLSHPAYTETYVGTGITTDSLPPLPPFQGSVLAGNIVTFDQSVDQYVDVAVNADFSFPQSVSAGASVPFTFSAWVRVDFSAGDDITLWTKYYSSSEREYLVYWSSSNDRFVCSFYNYNNGTSAYTCSGYSRPLEASEKSAAPTGLSYSWIHLAVTYDGRINSTDSYLGIRWYLNGVDITDTSQGNQGVSFTGMTERGTSFRFGQHRNWSGFEPLVGSIYDIAVWRGVALPARAISAMSDAWIPTTGLLNNPPRIRLRALDCATGSYPTAARLGDPGRTGRYPVSFNDTDTIVFGLVQSASYPSTFQVTPSSAGGDPLSSPGSRYIDQMVASPSANSTMMVTSRSLADQLYLKKGVVDANIHFTAGEDFSPFKEDDLHATTADAFLDPFYQTGSAPSAVGLGFTSPLRSKTKIVIELNPAQTTRFGELYKPSMVVSPSSPPLSIERRATTMVYFNHDLKRWEAAGRGAPHWGDLATGPPPFAPVPAPYDTEGGQGDGLFSLLVGDGMIGFSPGRGQFALPINDRYNNTDGGVPGDNTLLEGGAYPITNYGFPYHPKFHATSSQALKMSDYIDRPFLAEKFVLEYSASFGFDETFQDFDLDRRTVWPPPVTVGRTQRASSFRMGYQVKAVYPYGPHGGSKNIEPLDYFLAAIYTFFILNQRDNMSINPTGTPAVSEYMFIGGQREVQNLTASLPEWRYLQCGTDGKPDEGLTYVDTTRDLVTWGQHVVTDINVTDPAYQTYAPGSGFIASAERNATLKEKISREVNTHLPPSGMDVPPVVPYRVAPVWVSGSAYTMSGTFKSPGPTQSTSQFIHPLSGTGEFGALSNTRWQGVTRTGIEEIQVTGREINASVQGSVLTAKVDLQMGSDGSGNGNVTDWMIVQGQMPTTASSPYILMPEDELVMGWQYPVSAFPSFEPTADDQAYMDLINGHGKLTIYGTQLTDGHEYNDTLNQPLTSDAIHEAVGFTGPPLDQFDTEPRQMFSGGMLSNVVTGSMDGLGGWYGLFVGDRGVMAQKATSAWLGGQPTPKYSTGFNNPTAAPMYRSPGMARTLRLENSELQYYDCFVPSILDMWELDGRTILNTPVDEEYSLSTAGEYSGWIKNFPYQPKFHSLRREVTLALPDKIFAVTSPPYYTRVCRFARVRVGYVMGELDAGTSLDYFSPTSVTTDTALASIAKTPTQAQCQCIKDYLFGFGDGVSGSVGLANQDPTGIFLGEHTNRAIRGFKYGIYTTRPSSPVQHFNHSHFGYFRDMMEQSLDSRFFQALAARVTLTTPPVQIRFVSQDGGTIAASKTDSSNLSLFATSSLPYFDGDAKNRGPIDTAQLGLTIVST